MKPLLLLTLSLTLVGCGGATPVSQPPAHAATDQEAQSVVLNEPPPSVTADGANEAEAREAGARAALEVALDDAGWAEALTPDLDEWSASIALSETGARVRAEVPLSVERLTALFDALERAPIRVEAPAAWEPIVRASLSAHRARQLCERREALLGAHCEPTATEAQDADLAALASSVSIAAAIDGGVPATDGHPLRPPAVIVRANGAPVAGVPLRLITSGLSAFERETFATGPTGIGALPLRADAAWPSDVRVHIDAARMLGPLAARWPSVELPLALRPIGPARWAHVITERVSGRPAAESTLERALTAALGARGAPVELSRSVRAQLATGDAATRARRLPALADAMQGRLDVVFIAVVESEFASRMGMSRVWFEAHGELFAMNAWTGEVLAQTSQTVTESGVGDERADRAAREKLASALVEALLSARTLGGAGEPTPVAAR